MSKSSKQEQKQEVSIPDFYKPYYNNVLSSATSLSKQGKLAPTVAMSDDTSRGLDYASELASYLTDSFLPQAKTSFGSLLNSDLVNSAELQAAIQSATRPVQEQLERYTIPTTQDAAVAAGQLGSSRQGIAEGLARSDANQTMADTASNLSYGALMQDQNNKQFATSALPTFLQTLTAPSTLLTTTGAAREAYDLQAKSSEANNLSLLSQIVAMFNPGVNSTTTSRGSSGGIGSTLGSIASLGSLALGPMGAGVIGAGGTGFGSLFGNLFGKPATVTGAANSSDIFSALTGG